MTIITTDGRSMAGDGQTTVGWTITDTDTVKVHRLDDGRIFGCSGDASARFSFRDFLNGGSKPDKSESFAALVLCPDGRVIWYGDDYIPVECRAPQAIGCGRDFALVALDLGASPARAVEIACQRSAGCGGKITVLSI